MKAEYIVDTVPKFNGNLSPPHIGQIPQLHSAGSSVWSLSISVTTTSDLIKFPMLRYKKAVKELINTTDSQDVQNALIIRQQLAKSSVKKYQAMQNTVCRDGRAHGMFQFYDANRSGRWAGRLIQLQNLPQNHLSVLEQT